MPKNVSLKDAEELTTKLSEDHPIEDVERPEEPEEEVVEDDEEASDLLEVDWEDDDEWDSYAQDPEMEIWPGGPTIAQINAWKEEHSDCDVYVTSLTPERHVVWRTLTRAEYKNINARMEKLVSSGKISNVAANMENEDAIAQLCSLYPEYNKKNPGELAGLAATISQQVMEASGFSVLEVRQL